MRTVHETEALRPSDPVPKHHSSNPSNKFQRVRLVLSNEAKVQKNGEGKASTPASPTLPPPSASLPPSNQSPEDYAHNNVTYMQDLSSPGTPTIVQFPPDIHLTERELSLSAPDLFKLLRRQLHWATQEGEELRREAQELEKKRKEEWDAKELLVENLMEAHLSTSTRRRLESGLADDHEGYDQMKEDYMASLQLEIEPVDGKLPWFREKSWVARMTSELGAEIREDIRARREEDRQAEADTREAEVKAREAELEAAGALTSMHQHTHHRDYSEQERMARNPA